MLAHNNTGRSAEPSQEDYERAKDKARQLLRYVLPVGQWAELEEEGRFVIVGKRAKYILFPYSQTEVLDMRSNRRVAYACLQLTIPAPTYDRMVAEYLLIKNAEAVYWKTAKIFPRSGSGIDIGALFLVAFNLILFTNLLLEIILAVH